MNISLAAHGVRSSAVRPLAGLCLACQLAQPVAAFAIGREGPFPKPAEIRIQPTSAGRVLASTRGMSLYTFSKDMPGTLACIEACLSEFPPYLAPATATPTGDWSVIKRPDGTLQWAYRGAPLYTYHDDRRPGDVGGDARTQRSWVLLRYAPTPPPLLRPPVVGLRLIGEDYVLNDSRGLTLYQNASRLACDATCLGTWRPLDAAMLAHDVGDWKAVTRSDGTRQWSYRGHALFTYDGDRPGTTEGDGAAEGWGVARP